jgi:hypothetical protein
VLRVIKNDPDCEWLAGIVQQLGEKFFGVERFVDLTGQQRAGWIRFNYLMARIGRKVARRESDFPSLLRFLERVAEDEGSADLDQVEAEIEALAESPEAAPEEQGPDALLREEIADRRHERELESAAHAQEMLDWEARRTVQLAWNAVVLGATVLCVFVSTALVVLGATGDEPRLIGVSTITAGIAMVGLLKAIGWGRWNPPPPRQFR